MRLDRCVLAVLATAALAGAAPPAATPPSLPPATQPDQVRHLLRTGQYDALDKALSPLLTDEPDRPDWVALAARGGWERGRFAEATLLVQRTLQARPEDRRLLALLAEFQVRRGRYSKADKTLTRLLDKFPNDIRGRYWDGKRLQGVGRLTDADDRFRSLMRTYSMGEAKTAEELLLAGLSTTEYMLYHAKLAVKRRALQGQLSMVLNTVYVAALKAEPDFWPAAVAGGHLLLGRYNEPQARKEFQQALKINPKAAEAHLGLAGCAMVRHKSPEAQTHLKQALATNPALVDALALRAFTEQARRDWTDAGRTLDKALAIHRAHQDCLGLLGGIHLVLGRKADFDRLGERVLAQNPAAATFHATAGMVCEQHRKFDLAEAQYKQAIRLADFSPNARTRLGMLYMRVGREDEAEPHIKEAIARDPFNVRTLNYRKLLDHVAGYQTVRTDHYRVRLDPKLDGAMMPYVLECLEAMHGPLTERFGFQPTGHTPIEILDSHKWFSARTAGLPWIATIGASTGRIVAMTSPRATRKKFNWTRVLKHEVVHVITLQQTGFNIPHWYTEALAVLSEGYPRSESWQQLLLAAHRSGKLLDLGTINRAFQHPKSMRQRTLAYIQAELYAEFMLKQFGPGSLDRLLGAYRTGCRTPAAIQQSFGVTVKQFEQAYRAHVTEVVDTSALPTLPRARPLEEVNKAVASQPDNTDLLAEKAVALVQKKKADDAYKVALKALKTDAEHPLAAVVAAGVELGKKKYAAALVRLKPLRDTAPRRLRPLVLSMLYAAHAGQKQHAEALEALTALGKLGPLSARWLGRLADVHKALGNHTARRNVLEQLARTHADSLAARKELFASAVLRDDHAAAIRYGRWVVEIDPFDLKLHGDLGNAYRAVGNQQLALREFTVAGQLSPKSPQWPVEQARCLQGLGRPADALKRVRHALKLSPDNHAAKQLLKALQPPATTTSPNRNAA